MRSAVSFAVGFLSSVILCGATAAQVVPAKKDPLAPAGQSALACSPTDATSCAQAAAKILPQVLGPSPLEENLRRLTDEVGGRMTGSQQMGKAVDWAVGAFRAGNVEVHTEKYRMPATWAGGKSEVAILAPAALAQLEPPAGVAPVEGGGFPLRAVSEAWGPATPAGGLEGAVIDVGAGSEEEFARAGSIGGAILLVHTQIGTTWADLFNEYLQPPAIISRAIKGGAAAILWTAARERLLFYRHTNRLDGEIDRIPQAIVEREDALRLARFVAAYPRQVRVRL